MKDWTLEDPKRAELFKKRSEKQTGIPFSHLYFENRNCVHFPCHKGVDLKEGFNCMFCRCPYYYKLECPGGIVAENGFRDCTPCTYNHKLSNSVEMSQAYVKPEEMWE